MTTLLVVGSIAGLAYGWTCRRGVCFERALLRTWRRAAAAVRLYLYRRDRWTARRVGW